MKVIRSCLAALLTVWTLGIVGCGGADTGGTLVDGTDHTTTPAGDTAGAATTGGTTTGDDTITPEGTATGTGTGDVTAGTGTGTGGDTGGTTTGGDTSGTTSGGDTSGTTTGTLAPPVKATLLSDIQLTDSSSSVIFKITFDSPIDFASVTSKKSIILSSDAELAAGLLAAVFTFGAVDPIEVSTIPATYLAADNNQTVYLVASPSDTKTFRLKDSEGKWQAQPYHLIVFGADTSPSGYKARAVIDAQGIPIPNESRKQYECGTGKGKIPCGETVDVAKESN